jgi:hypothetical protein
LFRVQDKLYGSPQRHQRHKDNYSFTKLTEHESLNALF